MEALEQLHSILSSRRGTKGFRRKAAYVKAIEVYRTLLERKEKETNFAKSSFFHNVLVPLKNVDIGEDELVAVSEGLRVFSERLPESLKEYRVYGVTDPNNRWARATQYAKLGKKKTKEVSNVEKGKKERHVCDSCGAPLVRKGPARRFGWGLYRCDYCGSEYTIKE